MYDAIIIGGGPAGATAALYTARAGYKTMLIYKNYGALERAELVENFYGHVKIKGAELVKRGLRQARRVGVKVTKGEVVGLDIEDGTITVKTSKATHKARAVLLATGTNRTTPDIPGLAALEGHGVSYCAVCDGFFCRGKEVAVLGSGEYALHEVKDLQSVASKITLLTNGEEPTAAFPEGVVIRTERVGELLSGKPDDNSGIAVLPGLKKAVQVPSLSGVKLDTGDEILLAGLFVAVGMAGGAELARKIGAAFNSQGVIITDHQMKTSVSGLWAAGDCTDGVKQIAKAASDGALAGISMVEFLREMQHSN